MRHGTRPAGILTLMHAEFAVNTLTKQACSYFCLSLKIHGSTSQLVTLPTCQSHRKVPTPPQIQLCQAVPSSLEDSFVCWPWDGLQNTHKIQASERLRSSLLSTSGPTQPMASRECPEGRHQRGFLSYELLGHMGLLCYGRYGSQGWRSRRMPRAWS